MGQNRYYLGVFMLSVLLYFSLLGCSGIGLFVDPWGCFAVFCFQILLMFAREL